MLRFICEGLGLHLAAHQIILRIVLTPLSAIFYTVVWAAFAVAWRAPVSMAYRKTERV